MNQNIKKRLNQRIFYGLAVSTLIFMSGLGVHAQVNSNENLNVNESVTTPPLQESPDATVGEEVDQLNQQIDEKRKQIDELKRQSSIYEQRLEQKQNERASLQSELRDLDESIELTENELDLNRAEIESLQLQIQKVQREIAERQKEITQHRDELATLLRRLYETDQVSHLELVVQEQSFSGFFSRVQNLHALSTSIEDALNRVLEVKRQLDVAEEDLTGTRTELDENRKQLEASESVLVGQQKYKENLLEATQSTETKYQQLLQELKTQAASVDAEIESLIQQVNERLAARGEDISKLNPGQLSWPIDASRGISAYFHDPTYPFRRVFEHPAIDIRAPHGTAVTAAADGVVAIARKLDWVRDSKDRVLWPAYNFITIVHGGEIATVYGHLSVVSVSEGETIKRGQVIGKSGGTPGTAGAGRLTTGPHLHFEVRVNGIPDDPLKYLPSL